MKTTINKEKAILHRDGQVTYWSVYNQIWRKSHSVPDEELATMSGDERERVIRHLKKHESDISDDDYNNE